MTPSVIGLAASAKAHFGSSLGMMQSAISILAIFTSCPPSIQAVEGARIVVEDAVDHLGLDAPVIAQDAQRLDLGGGVGMAVIGADDDIVGAAAFEDPVDVVGALAGDIHVVGLQ